MFEDNKKINLTDIDVILMLINVITMFITFILQIVAFEIVGHTIRCIVILVITLITIIIEAKLNDSNGIKTNIVFFGLWTLNLVINLIKCIG